MKITLSDKTKAIIDAFIPLMSHRIYVNFNSLFYHPDSPRYVNDWGLREP